MAAPGGATHVIPKFTDTVEDGVIGQETDWIRFEVAARIEPGHLPAPDYYGPGTECVIGNADTGNVFGTITRIADMGYTELPGLRTGQFFPGGGWAGYLKYIPKMSSGGVPGTPNAITLACTAFNVTSSPVIGGQAENWCLVRLPSAPPVTSKNVAIISGSTVKQGPVPTPFSITVEGQQVYSSAPPVNPITPAGGGWGSW